MHITDFAMEFFSLRGKNAIVTGGNTGLGQAFALALAKAGADVFVPSIVDDDGSTREMIAAEGVRYEFVKTDLTVPGAPRQIVDACAEQLGSVDILVNSAGICPLASVLDFGRPQWDATVAVNLTAAFEMGHEAAKRMIPQRSGKIINVCSLFSYLGGQLVVGLRSHQARSGRLHQGLLRRARPVQRPGQRHRSRLLRHRDHRGDAERPGDEQARSRPHPGEPLGRTSTSWAPSSFWPAGLPTTSTATSSWSTAATWSAESTMGDDSMAGKYIIGVDGGSQSSKVVIFDLEGTIVCEDKQPLRPMSRPHNGIVEHPDDDLWASITAASRRAMAEFEGDPGDIIGLGLCTIRCERAYLRGTGRWRRRS